MVKQIKTKLISAILVIITCATVQASLELKLSADDYNASTGVWTDTSGQDNHASQSSSSLRPTLVAGQTPNGSSVVRFALGDYLYLTSQIPTVSDAAGYTVFAYLQDTASPWSTIICSVDSSGLQYVLSIDNEQVANRNNQAELGRSNTSLPSGQFSSINVKVNNAGGSYRLNGADDGTCSGSSFSASGLYYVGTHQAMVEQFQGDIAEIRVYSEQLTLSQIEGVEADLDSAYGTGSATIDPDPSGDCYVDLYDLAMLAADWTVDNRPTNGTDSCGDPGYPIPDGDIDKDCFVHLDDMIILAEYWLEDLRGKAYLPSGPRGLEQFAAMKSSLWNSPDIDWVNWVVVNTQPGTIQHGAVWNDAERLQFIDTFDPDICDWWSGGMMNWGDLARMRGIAADGGIEYEYESTLLGVTYLDDLIFQGNGYDINESGSMIDLFCHPSGWCYKQMTHLAPKWHEVVKAGNVRYSLYGDMVCQDNLIHGVHYKWGCFSDWANQKFIDYMTLKFTSEELTSMGFYPASFHILDYLSSKRSTMSNASLIEEPVIHEYIRFYYIESTASAVDISEQVKQAGFKAGHAVPAFYGNLAAMTTFRTLGYPLSEHGDVVWIEDSGTASSYIYNSSDIQAYTTTIYKIGRSAGHFQKPVWTTFSIPDEGTKRMPNAVTLAESHSNGGIHLIASHMGKDTTSPVWDVNRHHAQFVGQNRHLFVDRQSVADVAIAHSLPSLFWRHFSTLSMDDDRPHLDHTMVAARLLEDRHIPYDVLMFGHPDLYDDSDHLSRLANYRTIILPYLDCISNKQMWALENWVRTGGRLVLWAEENVGTRDEELRPRCVHAFDRLQTNPGAGEVLLLSTAQAQAYMADGSGAGTIAGLIDEEANLVDTTLPDTTWLNVWRHGAGPMTSVQMVNYNINVSADTATKVQNFTLCLREPEGVTFNEATYYHADYQTSGANPQTPVTLSLSRSGGFVEVTVPQLENFGIVAFTVTDELEARSNAAECRKWYQRLKISDRCPGQSLDNHSTVLAQAETLLNQIQGDVHVSNFASLIVPLQNSASDLELTLNGVTTAVTDLKAQAKSDTLNAANAIYKFDFGESGSTSGWTTITRSSNYSSSQGYGWTSLGQAAAVTTAYPDALHRDYIRAKDPSEYVSDRPNGWFPTVLPPVNEAHFRVDLDNGEYLVTAIVGDYEEYYHHSRVGVTYIDAEGEPMLYGDRLYAGYYQNRTFRVTVTDGSLDLKIWGRNGGPLYFNSCDWLINGLIIQTAENDLTPAAQEYLTEAEISSEAAIRNWYVLGPFDDDDCTGLDTVYPPESGIDLGTSYSGKNGTVNWQPLPTLQGQAPYVSLSGAFADLDEVAGFAVSHVYCPAPMEAVLKASTSQSGIGYVNGQVVFRDEVIAGLLPHEESVTINLNAGWNSILIKSLNHWGDEWSLWARLLTTDGQPLINQPGIIISAAGDQQP